MDYLNSVICWAQEQNSKSSAKPPIVSRSVYQFPALSLSEKHTLINYTYPQKKSKTTGKALTKDVCDKWGLEYLLVDGKDCAPAELIFLLEKVKSIPMFSAFSRIAVLSLDTNGYILPHSDLPVQFQVAVPLIVTDDFHYVWENWGEETLPEYSINLLDIGQKHAVWNTGPNRIFLNCTVGKFDSGTNLLDIFK